MADFHERILLLEFFMKYLGVAHTDGSVERNRTLFLGTRFNGSPAFLRREPGISLKNFSGAILRCAVGIGRCQKKNSEY